MPTNYQLPKPYSFRDKARTRFLRSRSLRQGQKSNQGHTMTLHTYTQCPYQVSTSYILQFLRYSPDKILYVKVTMARSKVKSRSHHDVAHLHLLTNVPTKVSTSYTLRFPRYSTGKIFKLKVTAARSKVKSRSHHDIAHLHLLTNVPIKYQLPTPYSF